MPNFSEGRSTAVLDAIGRAMADAGGQVLDVHADADHNRSVFTVVGDPDRLVEALAAGVAVAVAQIDLRVHEGVHPRIGSADVVPIVRFDPEDDRPERAARLLARRIAMLGVPVLGYGAVGEGRRPAFYRGQADALPALLEAGELEPLAGPAGTAPYGRGGAAGRAPAAGRVQRRPGRRRPGGGPRDRGGDPRARRRPARRAGDRAAARLEWARPGLDEPDRHRRHALARGGG